MSRRKRNAFGFLAIIILLLVMLWHSGGRSNFDEVSHAETQVGIKLESKFIDTGDVKLHVVFAGPKDGEPVIMLHGFPEFWYMWRHHIAALAKEGYRVAAPDMRGYNRSDKPSKRDDYRFSDYARDITGLMDVEGWDQANIISHDIGARVSWSLVFDSSERVKRAVIFSVGHPMAFETTTEKSDVSWYRTFFNMPLLPEFLSRAGGLSLIAKNMTESSREGTFTDEELNIYKMAWDRDHAFDSMLGAYRNFDDKIMTMPDDGRPEMPVLFIYGLDDKFISRDVAERSKTYLGAENVKILPNLSHWILAEDPQMTATEILNFLEQSQP